MRRRGEKGRRVADHRVLGEDGGDGSLLVRGAASRVRHPLLIVKLSLGRVLGIGLASHVLILRRCTLLLLKLVTGLD